MTDCSEGLLERITPFQWILLNTAACAALYAYAFGNWTGIVTGAIVGSSGGAVTFGMLDVLKRGDACAE